MSEFSRYAIYFMPEAGALADFGAAWLGWDAARGCRVAHPEVPGLDASIASLTATPRKYGFHATIKPPFRLAPGQSEGALREAAGTLCDCLAPVVLDGLSVDRLGGFIALRPIGPQQALSDLAAAVVMGLDPFRAAPRREEIARRQASPLSPRQQDLLLRWGYPYVLDEFHFHMTLTGRVADPCKVQAALAPVIAPLLPRPFRIGSLCLCGEAEGMFHILHRYRLSG